MTGPSATHSSEITCGAMSHSAPLSRRHGVLNGLVSSSDDPNHEARPPAQPPRAVTSASQARICAWNLRVKKTTDATSPPATAATRSSASACAMAMGFSSIRCLSARAAAAAMGACTSGGTAKATPSTAASSASTSAKPTAPCSAASAAAARGSRPQTPASSIPSVRTSAGACAIRAQWPVPTRPNLSGADAIPLPFAAPEAPEPLSR